MKDKIDTTLEYYTFKSKEIVDYVNKNKRLTVDEIIQNGEELAILEHKITSLEVAKEN
ncbi:MAG: hypothetical protein ACI863_000922 [Flavobacteriales bacterium]|jgi:hypothetical protein|tara:strand:+ start:2271 stop:2444 length:174 start_codon:yes stop_codon:yes gene_type:complete